LKSKVAESEKIQEINDRNLRVLKDSATHWKTKDSINAVTVGLLSATNDMLKTSYSDLDAKYTNLIKDYNKKIQKQTYLETQIKVKDSIIQSVRPGQPTDGIGSYVANDSTLHISDFKKYDARNYSSITGDIKLKLDSNKIKSANIGLERTFGIGIDLATYRDANGVPRVTVGTKYPGVDISVSGIQNVEDELQAAKNKTKIKSSFGLGIMAGYGYIIGNNTTLQKGVFIGIGIGWQPRFLQFNKK
jgi:hypothetical protein